MGSMSPPEHEAFPGPHDANPDIAALPPEDRDAFAQLATQGRLPGQNVELHFVPIHDLKRHRVTTFFCTPVFCVQDAPIIYGYRAFQNVGVRELPYIDRAILAHAVKFARRLAASGTVAAIGTCVHFETLAWSKGRDIYQHALRAAGVADYPFLILNVEEVPDGVASGRLADVIAAVRPYVRRVFLRLPNTETSVLHCGHLGISGLTMSLPPRASRVVAMGTAKWLLRECEAQGAHSCVDGIDSEASRELMVLAGVHFGAGTALGAHDFRGDAKPADIEAYMAEASLVEANENGKPEDPGHGAHLHA
ncbi:MAG TPA: hypothetical protein VMD53_06920 [Rhizomicrobium sp.]|nr:hypothetical protein [Rhizomicrobium sp.]